MNELKPCPFCGGADAFVETKDTIVGKRLRAICPNCMASVDTGWFQKKQDAVSAWNRRVEGKSGRWIRIRKNYCKCSECGTAYNTPVDWEPDKFCSECGARLFWEG